MKKKGQSKKAVSEIVTTILIILLVLAAIVIVWNVVKKTVTESSEDVGVKKFSVSLSASKVDLSEDPINISITRNAGAGNIISIKIVFKDDAGNSYIYENTTSIPGELETITYSISRDDILLTNLKSVEIYPIIAVSAEKNVTGIKVGIKEILIQTCTDECNLGENQCDGNTNQTCGKYDTDKCLERQDDDCSDCSCSCGDYGKSNEIGYCSDSIDNDCDTKTDSDDPDCTPSGLISWWRFEGNAYDERGVYNGTILGNTNCNSAGKKGFGCYFDGNGDYVSVNVPVGINSSVFMWVKRADVYAAWKGLACYTNTGYFTAHPTANTWLVNVYNSSNLAVTCYSATGLSNNTNWNFVGYTTSWSGSKIIRKVYYNGVDKTGTCGTLYESTGNINWIFSAIGIRKNSLTTGMNGSIDEVMIFNRALSASEIQSIYNSQK